MDWTRIINNGLEASVGLQAVVFALAAIGLNVQFGYTGLLNFGQSGFLAVAAYGLAVTVSTYDLPMWLGIIIGLLGAVVLALLLGIPTLRLRADYLAIVTIAAAEIIRLTVRSVTFEETFGGSDGRQAFAGDFYAINPYPVGEYNLGPVRLQRAPDVGAHRRLGPGRAVLPGGVPADAQPLGPGAAGRSARTRTPCAASARTSTPTRCRA